MAGSNLEFVGLIETLHVTFAGGITHEFTADTSFYLLHPAPEVAENCVISANAWEREINVSLSYRGSHFTQVLQTQFTALGLTPANLLQRLQILLPSLQYEVRTFPF